MEHTDQNQTPQASETLFVPLRVEACKADDVSLMAQALAEATKPGSRMTVQTALQRGLRTALKRKAIKVLYYLLDNGADVNVINSGYFFGDEDLLAKPSLEALEIVVAHGWDIDTRTSCIDWPLLWSVVRFHDLVEWCLDHGASVYLPGDTPPRDARGIGQVPRITVLEAAAERGSVPTFKLLREKGAPFHPGVLHAAVVHAVYSAPPFDGSAEPSTSNVWFNERMAMVRYLVDEAGIDVNTEWWRPYQTGATPLDFIAWYNTGKDVRELIWFLLDRGADVNHVSVLAGGYLGDDGSYLSSLEIAHRGNRSPNTPFLNAVQQWQERQRNKITQSDESRRYHGGYCL